MALVGVPTGSPAAGRATADVLALAGVNHVLQSGFRLLAEQTNKAIIETGAARSADNVREFTGQAAH